MQRNHCSPHMPLHVMEKESLQCRRFSLTRCMAQKNPNPLTHIWVAHAKAADGPQLQVGKGVQSAHVLTLKPWL